MAAAETAASEGKGADGVEKWRLALWSQRRVDVDGVGDRSE